MKLIQVRDNMTDVILLFFEAEHVYLATPRLFFADGKKYETGTEVYLETIDNLNGLETQRKSVARPLIDVQSI